MIASLMVEVGKKPPVLRQKGTLRMRLLKLSLVLNLVWATNSLAHPGHGDPGDGNTVHHFVTQPLHFIPILVVAFLVVGVSVWRKRQSARHK